MSSNLITTDMIMEVVINQIMTHSESAQPMMENLLLDKKREWFHRLGEQLERSSAQILTLMSSDDFKEFSTNDFKELSSDGVRILESYRKVRSFHKTLDLTYTNPCTILFHTTDMITSMRLTYGSSVTPLVRPYDILIHMIRTDLEDVGISLSELNFKLPH